MRGGLNVTVMQDRLTMPISLRFLLLCVCVQRKATKADSKQEPTMGYTQQWVLPCNYDNYV